MGTARTHCPQSVLAFTSALYHLRDKMARIAYAVLAVIALCLVAESQAIVRSLWGGWGLGLHGLGLNYGIGIGMPWGLGYGLGHGWGLDWDSVVSSEVVSTVVSTEDTEPTEATDWDTTRCYIWYSAS